MVTHFCTYPSANTNGKSDEAVSIKSPGALDMTADDEDGIVEGMRAYSLVGT